MAAQYWITFDVKGVQRLEVVYSSGGKSLKKADIREAYRKARKKGEAKLAKAGLKGRVINVQCVG